MSSEAGRMALQTLGCFKVWWFFSPPYLSDTQRAALSSSATPSLLHTFPQLYTHTNTFKAPMPDGLFFVQIFAPNYAH